MAIEDKEEKESVSAAPKGKNSKKLLIIIVIILLVLLLAGAGAYFLLRSPAQPSAPAPGAGGDVPGAPTESTEIGTMFPMETFIVNLADVLGKRYLRVTIQLEMDNPRLARELERRSPQLRDAVLTILASKKFEDISTAQGKLRLRSEIVSRVNAFLTSGSIRRVYFTEFVVQ